MSVGNALILAAGTSSRMGQPKQLLELEGQFVLERVIRLVLSFPFTRVYAVIGHQAEEIQQLIRIDDQRFSWLVNTDFKSGQSTSIKLGVNAALEDGSERAITIFLGDMPLIAHDTIDRLLAVGENQLAERKEPFVVLPWLCGEKGHPVFLGNLQPDHFSNLQGDRGGRSILSQWPHVRFDVEDEGVLFDIDTPEAYEEAKRYLREQIGKVSK